MSRDNHYPPEMVDLVRELTEKRTPNKEIARICEERFGLPPLAKTAISSFKTRFGIKEAPKYSADFLALIQRLRHRYDYPETLAVLKHEHGVILTRMQLEGICKNHKIHTGRSGRFGAPRAQASAGAENEAGDPRTVEAYLFQAGAERMERGSDRCRAPGQRRLHLGQDKR